MKQAFFIAASILISLSVAAQGNSGGKGKNKQTKSAASQGQAQNKEKEKGKEKKKSDSKGSDDQQKKTHDGKVWEGTYDNENDGPKPSKNQPAKVREAFAADYPGAQNVTWSKYRGDWTATFRNGAFTSTAVYHANGDRRDTRTPVTRQELPRTIFDEIFKKRPQSQTEEVIKVDLPEKNRHLYRIKEILDGKAKFYFVDQDGKEVTYNY
jgi:hypothetical protein